MWGATVELGAMHAEGTDSNKIYLHNIFEMARHGAATYYSMFAVALALGVLAAIPADPSCAVLCCDSGWNRPRRSCSADAAKYGMPHLLETMDAGLGGFGLEDDTTSAPAKGIVRVNQEVESIGVAYNENGDGLPSASDVVKLYQSNGITGMRLYYPDGNILRALGGTNISLILDVGNDQLASLAASASNAASWVKANVQPHDDVNIKYITVSNEVGGNDTENILPAMQNINGALSAAGLGGIIKVSTAVQSGVVTGFPPSQGAFSDSYIGTIAQYLASTGAPLLANVYPYFSYVDNQPNVDINYALFTSSGTVVQDGDNAYQNMFDAFVDTFYSALERVGAGSVDIVVSESGWPSAGGTAATKANAQTYNQNLIDHVRQGTPKRPGGIEAYIFAMFDEDNKTGAKTEHFGLFNLDKSAVYPINF